MGLPTVADVGAILHARTRVSDESGGDEAGTFTADTRPTADQVTALINLAAQDVRMRVGTVPERFNDAESACISLRAGMLVELSYTPEQIGNTTDRTVYQSLRIDYRDSLAGLVRAVQMAHGFKEEEPDPEPEL